jgi:ATP-dependent helicase/DNAse subunit B
VLHVSETEKPEDTLSITPIERGNLIHNALERFVRELPQRQTPWEPWTDTERGRLLEIGQELCEEAEAAGLTGRAIMWQIERARIMRDLEGFVDADEALRKERGVMTTDAEVSFGFGDEAPLLVEVGGRQVLFRGRIDRVDCSPGHKKLVVIDYKTGRSTYHSALGDDPVKRGQLLQLPVYALAAQERHGQAPVEAYYWFVTEREGYKRIGYALDDPRLGRFHEALQVITHGIQGGLFPARPGAAADSGTFENCRLCPFDTICPPDRLRLWERKRLAVELRDYLDLAEPMG